VNRTAAVQKINQGIGYRPSGNPLEGTIVEKLQEAQRDLEKGKTLPKFLLQEDQILTLIAGDHSVAKPEGFLREDDEVPLHFYAPNTTRPTFLERRFYKDAVMANLHGTSASTIPDEPAAPKVFVVRQATIDFITTADITYTLRWNYYKAAALLDSDIENAWLANAPEWLWGEAGYRLAMDLDPTAAWVAKFDKIRMMGRAAAFGEDVTGELASGPLQMGANL
jgi:hypothetical protein